MVLNQCLRCGKQVSSRAKQCLYSEHAILSINNEAVKIFVFLSFILLYQLSSAFAQTYNFKNLTEAYCLFSEKKIFYPDFRFPENSSIGLESIIDEQGDYHFVLIIDGKIAPIYNEYTELKNNNIWIGFEDRRGFRAMLIVALLQNNKILMFFLPEKTETADIFVRAYNMPREIAYSWYEPTLQGLTFHPESRTREEATKRYFTDELELPFHQYIEDGKQILLQKKKKLQKEKEEKEKRIEEERKRKKLEEERRLREERERIRIANTVIATIIAPEIESDVYIELANTRHKRIWKDSLLIGKYNVICTAKGYNTLCQEIVVTKKDTFFILDRMTPQTKSYTFTSPIKQNGTNVYVNDVYVGKTPITTNINRMESNKIEYEGLGYRSDVFYLNYNDSVTFSQLPNQNLNDVPGVISFSDKELSYRMEKHRSGGINNDGNCYLSIGSIMSSYPSFGGGVIFDLVEQHTNFNFSSSLNYRDSFPYFQTGFKLGWAVTGNYFRITPQFGLDFDWWTTKETNHDEFNNDSTMYNLHAEMFIPLGVRFEYALWRWLVVSVTPEIMYGNKTKKWYYGLRMSFSIANKPITKDWLSIDKSQGGETRRDGVIDYKKYLQNGFNSYKQPNNKPHRSKKYKSK